jgi:hypothetical protein
MSSATQKPALDQVVAFLEDSNGRDKFGKAIQYGARFLMWYHLRSDPKSDMGKRFQGLFQLTRDARKLPRLLKVLNEIKNIRGFVQKGGDATEQTLNIVSKAGFGMYWTFDNLDYLKKAKFYEVTAVDISYWAMFGWTVGLVASILGHLRKIRALNAEEATLLASAEAEEKAAKDRLRTLRAERTKAMVNMIGNLGDLVVSSNGIKLPKNVLGFDFNDGLVGVGGFVSAIISGYYSWKTVNK